MNNSAAATVASNPAPVAAAALPKPLAPTPAPAPTPASAPAPGSAVPAGALFAQLLGLATLPEAGPAADSEAGGDSDSDGETADTGADGAAPAAPDASLLGAMAPPLAPPVPTHAAHIQLAAPSGETPSDGGDGAATQANPALTITLHPAAMAFNAQGALLPNRGAAAPAALPQSADAASAAASAASATTAAADTGAAAASAPRPATLPADAERPAINHATPANSFGVTLANASGAASGDTVKLAGPAPQWQATLKDALGERLQVQLSRNSEHAVIRLDPPNLGRIEISIRHSAGALQVNLSASNGEVLRQLQTVGESMRQDLSQRQFSEVAVHVTATPRSAAGQSFGDGDARGRQPGRQQDDNEPGRALADAGAPASTFALNDRE
ncbi:flagellar hook-length control protein FliK [Janthinobacterium fluminis]|uniref:Flagellar hook-length control protein FliK n=1 Tax=Janthinobacterium fluminis TaxID=2987524 RepID=A0ABT5JWG4_9BURK|nr:flagellar hook-length control protein FliK [Janthinobacterium fluminis]MDC8756493.1 flagellar hook-length control protein FliK [Janthinobacterium fluminis]